MKIRDASGYGPRSLRLEWMDERLYLDENGEGEVDAKVGKRLVEDHGFELVVKAAKEKPKQPDDPAEE